MAFAFGANDRAYGGVLGINLCRDRLGGISAVATAGQPRQAASQYSLRSAARSIFGQFAMRRLAPAREG